MARIMEFFLNLLLLRGKLLTTTAAETLHEAIKKCLQFKRKIAMEYNSTQIILPFENMLELINYNSSQYTCEGDNFVITTKEEYDVYEKLRSEQRQFQDLDQPTVNSAPTDDTALENFETTAKKIEEHLQAIPDWLRREPVKPKQENSVSEDYIVDNLHAILKSQEYLFKNIIKLVKLLEKNDVLTTSNQKLEKVKKKLVACTDILSNNVQTKKFSSIINNIIEEEITRCRFRHGEGKTSAEINLKIPKPEGIEAALDTSCNKKYKDICKERNREQRIKTSNRHEKQEKDLANHSAREIKEQNDKIKENKSEVKVKALKRSKSDPLLQATKPEGKHKPNTNFPTIINQTRMHLENSKKLLEVNEKHFHKFEDELWHSLTTMKFVSLKDEYMNMCKCAFYNKRQFISTETAIAKKIKDEAENENYKNFEDVSSTMFQMMQRKLMFESVHEELAKTGQLSIVEGVQEIKDAGKDLLENNPFLKLKEESPQNESEVRTQTTSQTRLKKKESLQNSQTKLHPGSRRSETKLKQPIQEVKTRNKTVNVTKKSSKVLQDQKSSTVINRNNVQKLSPKSSEGVVNSSETITESKEKPHIMRNDQETNTVINGFKLTKSRYTDLKIRQNENVVTAPQKKKEDKKVESIRKSTEEVKSNNLKENKSKSHIKDKSAAKIIRSNSDPTYDKMKISKTVSTSNIQKLRPPRSLSEGDILRSNEKEEVLLQKLPGTSSQSNEEMSPRKQKLYFTQLLKRRKAPKKINIKQNVEQKPLEHSTNLKKLITRNENSKDVKIKEVIENQHTDSTHLSKKVTLPITPKIQFPQNLTEKSASKEETISESQRENVPDTQKLPFSAELSQSTLSKSANINESIDEKPPNSSPLKEQTTSNQENSLLQQDATQSETSKDVKVKKSTETLPLFSEETSQMQNLFDSETLKHEEAKDNLKEKTSKDCLEREEKDTSNTQKLELQQHLSDTHCSQDICEKEKLSGESVNDVKAPSPRGKLLQSEIFENQEQPDRKIVDNVSSDRNILITQKLIIPQNTPENKNLDDLEKKIARASSRSQEKMIIIPGLRQSSVKSESVGESMKKSSQRALQKNQRDAKPRRNKSREQVRNDKLMVKLQVPKNKNISPQAVSALVAKNNHKLRNIGEESSDNVLSLIPEKTEKMPRNWKGVIENISPSRKMRNITGVPKKSRPNSVPSSPGRTPFRSVKSTAGRSTTKVKNVIDEKLAMSQILEKHSRTISQPFTKIKNCDNVEQKMKNPPEIFTTIQEDALTNIKTDTSVKVNLTNVKKEKETTPKILSPKNTKQEVDTNEQKAQGQNSKLKITANKLGKILTVPYDSHKRKRSASTVDLKNETDKANTENSFKELEAAVRTVKIFVEKSAKNPTKLLKTTTEKGNRKIDEPGKKSMSTKQLVSVLRQQSVESKNIVKKQSTGCRIKQEHKYSTPSEQISNDIILNRHRPFKEVTKQNNYSLATGKTFLKKSSNIYQQTSKSASSHERQKSKQSLTKICETVENNKPNLQMRRTTKNAMKRQQASVTILPKLSKNPDKKRSKVALVDLKDVKSPGLGPKKQKVEKKGFVGDNVSKPVTNLGGLAASPRSAFSNPLLNRILNKTPYGKIHCVRWQAEEDIETVDVVKS